MKTLRVYDPPMCCSTGVCGPEIDPTLVRFAADLSWIESHSVTVERFNLAQSPMAFVQEELVRSIMSDKGQGALPLVLVDGNVVASGCYPPREDLIGPLGISDAAGILFTPAVAELVAIGAAVAANCEPCLRDHVAAAAKLGVSPADIAHAIDAATKVKDVANRSVVKLSAQLLHLDHSSAGVSA